MARGVLSVQAIDYDGLSPAYTSGDATDGHQFLNPANTNGQGKKVFLHVKNGGGADPCVVTIQIPYLIEGRYAAVDKTVSVPAGEERMITDFTPTTFNQDGEDTVAGQANYVLIDLDQATSVTLGVFKTP